MSPISFFNPHPRADFSAFLDGELPASRAARLEKHLAACTACTAELEGLRAVRAAMRQLPEATAPRSFAITPEMARDARPARAVPAQRPLQPLVNGLRLTSAGLATALAIVVVVAIAGGGANNGGGDGLAARMESTNAEYASVPAENLAWDADGVATGAPAPTEPYFTPFPSVGGTPQATVDTGTGSGSGGAGGGGTGGSGGVTGGHSGGIGTGGGGSAPADDGSGEAPPPVTIAPGQGAQVEPSPAPATGDFADKGVDSTQQPLAGTGGDSINTGQVETTGRDMASDGGGPGTLTIVAIVLGVLLGAALIGSIAASRLSQKTH